MKETPKELKIHLNLKVGVMSTHGFLGDDDRHFHEIIEEDESILTRLGVTTEEIADRLQYFTDEAFESYDGPITIGGKYEVHYESFRGKMPCPFDHVEQPDGGHREPGQAHCREDRDLGAGGAGIIPAFKAIAVLIKVKLGKRINNIIHVITSK